MHRSVLAFLLLSGICGCLATLLFLLGRSVRWLKLYSESTKKRRSIKFIFLASLFYGTLIVYALAPPLEEKPSKTFLFVPLVIFSLIWPFFVLSQRFYHNNIDVYHSIVSIVLGCQFAWLFCVSLAVYCLSTMNGTNMAATPHYHGPARIVGYESFDNGDSATVLVAYGASWACPKYSELDCQVELNMSSCTIYDQTGLWSGHHQDSYWNTWGQKNHWQDRFSCAAGFLDVDFGNNDDSGSASYTFADGLFDPSTNPVNDDGDSWPYLIQILADCQQCGAKIDDKRNRLVFSATSDLLSIMAGSVIACFSLLSLATFLSNQQKKEKLLLLFPTDVEAIDPL